MLFPTPPLPDRTRTFRFTRFMRSLMNGMSGSGPFGAVEQIDWFGQPWQLSALPACSLSVPGQASGASSGRLTIVGAKFVSAEFQSPNADLATVKSSEVLRFRTAIFKPRRDLQVPAQKRPR